MVEEGDEEEVEIVHQVQNGSCLSSMDDSQYEKTAHLETET